MTQKEIFIDFSGLTSLKEMHDLLKEKLFLPDFYGENVNALIDCLSSLRYPDDQMIGITLDSNEYLIIQTKNLNNLPHILFNNFIISIENVNRLEMKRGKKAMIYLVPV